MAKDILEESKRVTSRLVSKGSDAIGRLKFPKSDIIDWFGQLPSGLKNVVTSGEVKDWKFTKQVDTKYRKVANAPTLRWGSLVSK